MGFVDRGGGREAKGTSLRRSKKNPGAAATRNKGAHKKYVTPTTRATPAPPAACGPFIQRLADATDAATAANACVDVWKAACDAVASGTALHVDTAVALLSRKLEDDQEGVFRRAVEEGKLAGALCWSVEVEKQATLLDTCVQHNKLLRGAAAATDAAASTSSSSSPSAAAAARHVRFQDDVTATTPSPVAVTGGATAPLPKRGVVLYAILGIHVNSVDRVHMRQHEQWVNELEESVKHGEVVGVLSGLNWSRDHGTHYAQERLMRECWRVAAAARLPLVLHLYAADTAALTETVNRAAELIHELLGNDSQSQGSATATTTTATAAAAAAPPHLPFPSAIVLYNGLQALHASPAMQQLVRAHRPGASSSTTATSTTEGASAPHHQQQHSSSVVPFYVLVTADGLGEQPPAATTQEAEEGKEGAAASVEHIASLLPCRVVDDAAHGHDKLDDVAADDDLSGVLHLSQLLIGTGAPWGTPQNLPDPHLCTLPNEPGNYHYVVKTVFDAMKAPRSSSCRDGGAAPAAVSSADQLAAYVFLNQLRVFFHECIAAAANDDDDDDDDDEVAAAADDVAVDGGAVVDADARQQRQWLASQQPAAATAVAGLSDGDAKRDLEALLAEAAQERERVERERLREEAARAQARSEELHERRNRREKKKNVKANNRSNFTHFRNKDFAPRQSKQERLAHPQGPEGDGNDGSDDDSSTGNDHDEGGAVGRAAGKTSTAHPHHHASSNDGDSSADDEEEEENAQDTHATGGLAAEVEQLLKEAESKKNPAGSCNRTKAGKNTASAAATTTPPPAATATGQGKRQKKNSSKIKAQPARGEQAPDGGDDSGHSDDDVEDARAAGSQAQQPSRRQRKRQQKRQKQMKGDDSDDDGTA
ncbi:hypothetical protein ABB37_09865 [Leptomonas pyrrhocoris]|uniref:DAD domain-containing protein n=1 Tax=Leptomonas pyrrhocoris TaxID=157538 RepID=A0A0N1J488_LEPPY|nr:hypothetical protein ABB37_09865 [Leptomonas pyrrhocoris]KPA73421.1 hypothetical protein ABB37_09865 [Leptomonas pyrrhocoris]|eukprot:XP_015651860.1 hypothetical protein ABB37_09865 [Leptomonas pyrrhocoris]